MVASAASNNDRVVFHREMQALLAAEDEQTAREVLLSAMRQRLGTGAVFVGRQFRADGPPMMRGLWAQTIWQLPEGIEMRDLVGSIAQGMPRWLNAWFTRVRRPTSLSRLTRFIPYSSRAVLKLGSPKGVPPLRDIVWTPYKYKTHHYCLAIGFFQEANDELLGEIVTLSLAYTVKWINCLVAQDQTVNAHAGPRLDLSERELDCLRWLVAGKTMRDIANIMDMSYANVRYHLEKARDRHGYASVQQLMVHAAMDYSLSPLGPETEPDSKGD